MTRVWLEPWEWACCGDAFVVGDDVDFGIRSRTAHPSLSDGLGPELMRTIDAIESHHESEFTDRVRGRVVAVHAVTHEFTERRTLRRPGHGAPPNAVMPAEGEEWPINRVALGNGFSAGTQPSRYITEMVPVPGTAVLTQVRGVGTRQETALPSNLEDVEPSQTEQGGSSIAGWLVDVEE